MGKTGAIGEALEVIHEEVEQAAVTAKQQITGKPSGTAQGQQGSQTQSRTQQPSVSDQIQGLPSETANINQPQDDSTKQFVADLYGGKTSSISEAEIQQKELEDKQKAEALRQRLHSQYYEKLTQRPPQGKQQEERPAEKIEREEEEKKTKQQEELAKKQQDELPAIMTKDRGTKEKLRGVSG